MKASLCIPLLYSRGGPDQAHRVPVSAMSVSVQGERQVLLLPCVFYLAEINGPVNKSKNSAETHRFSGITLELAIEKDSIYHSFKI